MELVILHLKSKRITLVRVTFILERFLFWPQSIFDEYGSNILFACLFVFNEIKRFNFSGGRCPDHNSRAQSI